MTQELKIILIAGPNGAGKTTFAREFLPQEAGCPVFVNADLIAEGLSPFSPEASAMRAGRLMLEEIAAHVRRLESFAFETTLSGRLVARMIPKWQKIGYRVKLLFLHVSDVQIAVDRVAVRVAQGGHHVPESVIRRRYHKGWRNFQDVYRQMVDIWALYDNSGKTPVLIDGEVNR